MRLFNRRNPHQETQDAYNAMAAQMLPPPPVWELGGWRDDGSHWHTTIIVTTEQEGRNAAQRIGATSITRFDRCWDTSSGNYTPGEIVNAVCITGGR